MNFHRLHSSSRHAALVTALFVACSVPSICAQPGGVVSGVITTKAPGSKPLRVTMDQRVCGSELPDETVVVDANGRLANAVVVLVGVKSPNNPTGGSVMNDKCRFAPRVQIARPSATITTSSKDPILHTTNAAMDGGKGLFNVAVPVPGITISRQLNGPGLVRVVCNTHPWMRGYIMVTDDVAAVTGADGTFKLTDVPAGTYQLRVWHESLHGTAQNITVTAGQTATANFELK